MLTKEEDDRLRLLLINRDGFTDNDVEFCRQIIAREVRNPSDLFSSYLVRFESQIRLQTVCIVGIKMSQLDFVKVYQHVYNHYGPEMNRLLDQHVDYYDRHSEVVELKLKGLI